MNLSKKFPAFFQNVIDNQEECLDFSLAPDEIKSYSEEQAKTVLYSLSKACPHLNSVVMTPRVLQFLKYLDFFPSLKKIEIRDWFNHDDFNNLLIEKSKNIELLIFDGVKFSSDVIFRTISQLKNLKYLKFFNCFEISDDWFSYLENCKNLETLIIECPSITNDALMVFQELKKIKCLSLIRCGIDGQGLSHLDNLEELEELYLNYDYYQFDELSLKMLFSFCPKLKKIYFGEKVVLDSPLFEYVWYDENPRRFKIVFPSENQKKIYEIYQQARSGTLSSAEIQFIVKILDSHINGKSLNEIEIDENNIGTLIEAIGLSGESQYRFLVENYLFNYKNYRFNTSALKTLCDYWRFHSDYLKELKMFARGVDWDTLGFIQIAAISSLGEFLRKNHDKEALKLLYNLYEKDHKDEVTQEGAYEALARAVGEDWEKIGKTAWPDPEVINKIRKLINNEE